MVILHPCGFARYYYNVDNVYKIDLNLIYSLYDFQLKIWLCKFSAVLKIKIRKGFYNYCYPTIVPLVHECVLVLPSTEGQ